jgi:hypothetical protein
MTPDLATICSEFGIEIVPNHVRRGPMQSYAGKTMETLIRKHGAAHLRMVLMTIVETENHANALAEPILWAVSDVVLAHPSWVDTGSEWLSTFDKIDLLDLWGRVKVGRTPSAREAIAAILIDRLSVIFPPEKQRKLL